MITTDFTNGIMNPSNNHDVKLVKIINEAWEIEELREWFYIMVFAFNKRDNEENKCITEEFNDSIIHDTLMNVCDDSDLKTLIDFIKWDSIPVLKLRKEYADKRLAKYKEIIDNRIEEKLKAIEEICRVAYTLNGIDWKPDFNDKNHLPYSFKLIDNAIIPMPFSSNTSFVYFKDALTIQNALNYIPNKTIYKAFS